MDLCNTQFASLVSLVHCQLAPTCAT